MQGRRRPFPAPPPPRAPSRHPKYAPLRHRAARPAPPHADPVESPPPLESDEILRLRKRLDELYIQDDELTPTQEQLEESVGLLLDEIYTNNLALEFSQRHSTLQDGVIPFAAAIDQANRYFDFKKAAKDKYHEQFHTTKNLQLLDIVGILRDDEELKLQFNKVGELEFRQAARAICYELEDEQRAKQHKHWKKREDPVLVQPIYNLVFQTRQQDIVMDQNPVVELEKIMKFNPSLYDACFRLEVPPEECLRATMEANESYSEFWSKYVKAASGAEPSVVKAEDDDYVFSSPGTDGSGENLIQKLGVLDQQLKKLLPEKELWDVKCQKVFDEIRGTRIALRESERRSALPYAVIPFVAAIEKANRYFEYKEAVKEKYRLQFSTNPYLRPLDIAGILDNDHELNSEFNKSGDLEIEQAPLAVYFELGDERRLNRNVPWRGDLQNRGLKKRRDMALDQPIYNLVFQARVQRVVMDEDPTVELEKIMESNSSLYDACFDMSGKPVDGLATAVAQARIKYSEIWSTYFKPSERIEGKTSRIVPLVDLGKTSRIVPLVDLLSRSSFFTGASRVFGAYLSWIRWRIRSRISRMFSSISACFAEALLSLGFAVTLVSACYMDCIFLSYVFAIYVTFWLLMPAVTLLFPRKKKREGKTLSEVKKTTRGKKGEKVKFAVSH